MASKKVKVDLDVEGSVEGTSFVKTGGTSSQYLKADGSVSTGTWNTIIGTDTDISYSGATVLNTLVMTDGVITSHSSRTLTLANLGYTGATNANNYIHPSYSATNINTSGATIVDVITTNSTGHVTALGTRTLSLADLGYSGASDANKYIHPTYAGDDISIDTGALTGATVISDLDFNVTTDSTGHVTDANATVSTRNLTLADLGYTGNVDGGVASVIASTVDGKEGIEVTNGSTATVTVGLDLESVNQGYVHYIAGVSSVDGKNYRHEKSQFFAYSEQLIHQITGNGTLTTFAVWHDLGYEALIQVYDWNSSSPYYKEQVFPKVKHEDDSNVQVTFNTAPATGQNYRVLMSKVNNRNV